MCVFERSRDGVQLGGAAVVVARDQGARILTPSSPSPSGLQEVASWEFYWLNSKAVQRMTFKEGN